jgi:hypothetical protein
MSGQKFTIHGNFTNYGVISPYGCIKNATFYGTVDMQGTEISVEVHFSDDCGIILEKARPIDSRYQLIEANQSFAVFFFNGKEEILIREPDSPWNPLECELYGRITGPLVYFIA